MCPIGVEVMVGADGDSPFGAGIEPATFRFSERTCASSGIVCAGHTRHEANNQTGWISSSDASPPAWNWTVVNSLPRFDANARMGRSGSSMSTMGNGRGKRVCVARCSPCCSLIGNQHAANHGVSLSASNRSVRLVVAQHFHKLAFLFGQQSGKRGFHDSRHRKNSRSVWPGPNGIDGHTLGYPAQ